MKRARVLLLLPVFAFPLAGCGHSDGIATPKTVPADAVAMVGDTPVTKAQFDAILAATISTLHAKGQDFPLPGDPTYRNERNKILDGVIHETEYEQTAKDDLGVEISDNQLDNLVLQYKQVNYDGSEARFRAGLKKAGTTELMFRLRRKEGLLADAVFQKLAKTVTVSDAEVEAYYKQHLEGYRHPPTREVRHILVKTKPQAEEIVRKLRGGADFAKLAQQYSTDAETNQRGGKLPGEITPGQTIAPFDKVAFTIKTNAISEPVHSQYGWHVIQATTDIKPAYTTPLDDVRKVIAGELVDSKRTTRMKAWVNETKAAYASKILYASGYGPPKGSASAAQGG